MKKNLILLIMAGILASGCVKPVVSVFGSIYGVVSDTETGEPLRAASVVLSPGNFTTVTGSDGHYEFEDLTAGQYKIQIKASGYETNSRQITVVAGNKTIGDMTLTPEVRKADFELSTAHINFDTDYSEFSIEIKNTGNEILKWSVTDVEADWLMVTPAVGETGVGRSSSIKVKADRAKVSGNETVYFNINAAGGSKAVMVTIKVEKEEAYIDVQPSTEMNFGLNEMSEELVITAHHSAVSYNIDLESYSGNWLTLSRSSGTVPEYETTQRREIISVAVDRDGFEGTKASCILVVKTALGTHSIKICAEKIKEEEPYVEVTPLNVDFGLSLNSKDIELKAYHKSVTYTVNVEWCEGGWLNLSKVSGTIPDYNETYRKETITMSVDRTKMKSTNESCVVTIAAGLDTYRINVTAMAEKKDDGSGNDGDDGGNGGEDDDSSNLLNGLYTYYKFDGNFNDSSENGINGFGSNNPKFVTGVDGQSKAVKFSKTENSSFVVAKPILDSKTMTVSFWGKDFSDGGIFHMVSSDNNETFFTLSMSGGALKYIVRQYNNWYQYNNCPAFTHPTITDGKWHHIVITTDFNVTEYATITSSLYVNGQQVDTVTEYQNPFSASETYGMGIKFIMGGDFKLSNSSTLKGTNMTVDNFRVYDTRKLSDREIKLLYDTKN